MGNTSTLKNKILIVNNQQDEVKTLKRHLESIDYDVITAPTEKKFYGILNDIKEGSHIDTVIMAHNLPNSKGFELINKAVVDNGIILPVFYITGSKLSSEMQKTISSIPGVQCILPKSFTLKTLEEKLFKLYDCKNKVIIPDSENSFKKNLPNMAIYNILLPYILGDYDKLKILPEVQREYINSTIKQRVTEGRRILESTARDLCKVITGNNRSPVKGIIIPNRKEEFKYLVSHLEVQYIKDQSTIDNACTSNKKYTHGLTDFLSNSFVCLQQEMSPKPGKKNGLVEESIDDLDYVREMKEAILSKAKYINGRRKLKDADIKAIQNTLEKFERRIQDKVYYFPDNSEDLFCIVTRKKTLDSSIDKLAKRIAIEEEKQKSYQRINNCSISKDESMKRKYGESISNDFYAIRVILMDERSLKRAFDRTNKYFEESDIYDRRHIEYNFISRSGNVTNSSIVVKYKGFPDTIEIQFVCITDQIIREFYSPISRTCNEDLKEKIDKDDFRKNQNRDANKRFSDLRERKAGLENF